jgi:hypothetical protein
MSLIISVAFFAAVLLASGTSSANQSDWTRARLACDDVGIDPNSLVSNLRVSADRLLMRSACRTTPSVRLHYFAPRPVRQKAT